MAESGFGWRDSRMRHGMVFHGFMDRKSRTAKLNRTEVKQINSLE